MQSLLMKSFGWNHGSVGDGLGYSNRISIRLLWEPRDIWIGVYWNTNGTKELFIYICLLPCLPLRIHRQKSFGGIFPEAT